MTCFRKPMAILLSINFLLCFIASDAVADPYQLWMGDEISVEHSGIGDPLTLIVDVDGKIRLTTIGSVHVAGLTLDAAEEKIKQVMTRDGLFVNPTVNLGLRNYAPIFVGGDVANAGRFTYTPAMTVAAALALSGGQQLGGLTRTEIARAEADAQAGRLTANLEIALASARLARFQAVLAGQEKALNITPMALARIPSPTDANLETILNNEADVLAGARMRSQKLLAFWEDEIATIAAQAENYDARIAVQREIVDSMVAGLEASQELSERGLQTASRLAVAEQRAADARSRVLELEAAKLSAARATSEARRARTVFLSNQERDALQGIQEAKKDLETATYRYQRFQTQSVALRGIGMGQLPDRENLQVSFVLQSSRPNRPKGSDITLDTSLLPGDVLVVSVTPIVDELDG